jgi:hypothetical protein
MKYLIFIALLALAACRIHHRQDAPAAPAGSLPAFQGEAEGNYWWPVDSFNTYAVCANRCRAAGFVVAELKTQGNAARVLEQYCCHEAGDVAISLLGQNHPEVEGWEGYDDEPTWGQLDHKSRVCPEFQRVGHQSLIPKVGYAWFNQRVVSCPWSG